MKRIIIPLILAASIGLPATAHAETNRDTTGCITKHELYGIPQGYTKYEIEQSVSATGFPVKDYAFDTYTTFRYRLCDHGIRHGGWVDIMYTKPNHKAIGAMYHLEPGVSPKKITF